MWTCNADTHRYAYPWGRAELQGGQLLIDVGSGETMTCCEIHKIHRRRQNDPAQAVPSQKLTSSYGWALRRVDQYAHDHGYRRLARITCALWDQHLGIGWREAWSPGRSQRP